MIQFLYANNSRGVYKNGIYFVQSSSDSGKGRESVNKAVRKFSSEKVETKNVLEISDYRDFFASIDEKDDVVLIGGDGTIHVMVNQMRGVEIKNRVFIYKSGTGNDFLRDIYGKDAEDGTIRQINDYIDNLPVVTIKNKEYLFLNNVGYGIDGKVCTAVEERKNKGKYDVNYTSLAIKLMMTYKTSNATIIVDGEEHRYKKVWLSPIMNGRFYGGGMMIAPHQDRKSDLLSVIAFYGTTRLQTLMIFPSIFKGEHIKHKKHVEILQGKKISVRLHQPQDVQIDGEVIRDVREISAVKYATLRERDEHIADKAEAQTATV